MLQTIAPTANHRATTNLQLAQQKLLSQEGPFLLRSVSYLRLSCLGLGKPGAYSQLLQALTTIDANWWQTCAITPAGNLKSTHPAIDRLLRFSIE